MRIRSATALESSINVTPFVDICLVLLIIFMILVPAMTQGLSVKLPIAKGEAVPDALKQIVITVKDDGTIYLGTLIIRKEQFASEIERAHSLYPQRAIAVGGDRRVAYGAVVDVLDACRAVGFTDVRLLSQQRTDAQR